MVIFVLGVLMKIFRESLTYDDVLFSPKYSEIKSRADVDVSVTLTKGLKFKFPIIPANMKTVTGPEMANFIADEGGLAILNRFIPIEDQFKCAAEAVKNGKQNNIGISIGVKKEDYSAVNRFVDIGIKIICLDIAHCHSIMAIDMIKHISTNFPDIFLIAGNVATKQGTRDLFVAGADCVKIGLGNGSICSTRINAGVGVPSITAIMDALEAKENFERQNKKKVFLVADGGMSKYGDCAKALAFADLVMVGSMLAGSDCAPGEILEINGQNFKSYVGSSTHKSSRIEGVEAIVPYKGPTYKIIKNMIEGIQSACSYSGVNNLTDLKEVAEFVKVTHAGFVESGIHDVIKK